MKTVSFEDRGDGSYKHKAFTNNERVSFALFKQIHGGELVNDPALLAKFPRPEGFGLWKTKDGQFFGVRDDGGSK